MINRTTLSQSALLVFCVLITCGCDSPVESSTASVEQPVDSSTSSVEQTSAIELLAPESVLEKFYLSLANSEKEAALACTTGDPLTEEFIDSQIRLNAAFALFGKNALEKFPEEGQSMQMPSPALLAAKKVSQVPVIVAGTNATWPSNPSSPLRLELTEGQWKINLANSFPSPDLVQQSNKTFDGISSYITDIANEMAAGKYETVAMVRQELKRRGQAAKQ